RRELARHGAAIDERGLRRRRAGAEHATRQIARDDLVARALVDQRLPHDVAQLADVAGPGIGGQRAQRVGTQAARAWLRGRLVGVEALEEALSEVGQVLLPLAQRRQRDRDDGEAL